MLYLKNIYYVWIAWVTAVSLYVLLRLSKKLEMEDVAVMALWCYSLPSLERAVLHLLERVLSDPSWMQNLETVVTDSLLVSRHDLYIWNQCLKEQLLLHWIEFKKHWFPAVFNIRHLHYLEEVDNVIKF